ncbi:MAG: lysylphosphatidylglycerol synthase transmembrane domain-containing protein [Candidatus Gracilibacteria bacterium]
MKTFWKILRYVILIAIIAFAINRVIPQLKDFSTIWELKNSIKWNWVIAAIGAQFFQYVGDGWLSLLLLKIINIRMKLKDTFRIAALNVFAAQFLPIGEAGGLAAAYHFYKKLGVTTEQFIFLTICWGVITNTLLILMLIVPVFLLPQVPAFININTILIILGIVLAIGLVAYMTRHILFKKLEKILGKRSWSKHLMTLIKNRSVYKKLVSTKKNLYIPVLLSSAIYYAANIAALSFSFMAFGTFPEITLVIFAYAASIIFGRITLTPGGIGTAEATLILIFMESGIASSVVVAAVLLYRIMAFWLPIPGGFISFYSLRKETGKINTRSLKKELEEETEEFLDEKF